jgi:hypothetical protein
MQELLDLDCGKFKVLNPPNWMIYLSDEERSYDLDYIIGQTVPPTVQMICVASESNYIQA